MKRFSLLLILTTMFLMNACQEDFPDYIPQSNVSVEVILPDSLNASNSLMADSVNVSFKNITTGKTFTFHRTENISLPEGLYDCNIEGKIQINNKKIQKIKGYKQSVKILGAESNITLNTFKVADTDGFVFEEIFFTGVLTPQGKQYYGCSYFKIRNNTDKLLYADSLAICESRFVSVMNWNYTPDIRHEAMPVFAIYMIPGSGKDVPVKPGESLLIADIAIDHRKVMPNGYDLSGADFEWYDESPHPRIQDLDNPLVPNLEKIYCYTLTIWIPHNRGFRSYGLARMKEDKETFLKNYKYEYTYIMNLPQGVFPMEGFGYKIPNEWLEDVVNCSIESKFVWLLVDPSLDCGWTNCGKIDHDKTRYDKSVRRKVAYVTRDGREVLQDTNNSTEDFIAEAVPSMMPAELLKNRKK